MEEKDKDLKPESIENSPIRGGYNYDQEKDKVSAYNEYINSVLKENTIRKTIEKDFDIVDEAINEVPVEESLDFDNLNTEEYIKQLTEKVKKQMADGMYGGQIQSSKKPLIKTGYQNKKGYSTLNPGISIYSYQMVDFDSSISEGSNNIKFTGGYDPYIKEEKQEMKKDCKYRVLLSHNGMKVNYIRCPKDYNGTDDELLDLANNGSDPNVRYIPYIPQFDKNGKEIKPKKKASNKQPIPRIQREAVNQITADAFGEKNNNLFTKEISMNDYLGIYTRSRETSNRDFIRTITVGGTCLKDILIYNNYTNSIGLTTGIVKENGIETISLSASNFRYTDKTCYKLEYYPTNGIDIVGNVSQLMCFFRLKLKSSNSSKDLFGISSVSRKKMEGRLMPGYKVNVRSRYISPKNGVAYQVYEVINDARDAYILYLDTEATLLTIDPKLLGSFKSKTIKRIEKGKKAIIKDDRRLINLKKGDVVMVDTITPKMIKRMSTVSIVDSSGKKQTILLKQLRPYAEADKKTSIKEGSKKSSISTDINIGKAKGGEAFGKATNKPKSPITEDDFDELPY